MKEMCESYLLNFIGGSWVPDTKGSTRSNLNPADRNDVVGDFADSDARSTRRAIDAADGMRSDWDMSGPIARAEVLTRARHLLAERSDTFARVITREQGKRLTESRSEVKRSLDILDFTIGEARRLNGVTTPAEEPRTVAMTFRRPMGTVGLITPWNFPLAIPMWKVAPALLSGCTAVLKPSPVTPLTSAMLVGVFEDAGVPAGVLNLVQGDTEAGQALVDDPRIAGVSFTGSLPVGQAINRAGAERLMKAQLELGGKNAVVVLDDAVIDDAVSAIVHGAFGQSGQRCSATSRVIVDERVKQTLLDALLPTVATMRVGPGTEDWADIGPVITSERRRACLEAVEVAENEGADVQCGGTADENYPQGNFVKPTVLVDVPENSQIAQEEIFGPVLSVIDCAGFDEAMRIANSVRYGMSGTIFTQSQARTFEALQRLEAGMLHVNRAGVGSYAHLPHMGVKASQLGPPECSPEVWDFYTDLRSACISY